MISREWEEAETVDQWEGIHDKECRTKVGGFVQIIPVYCTVMVLMMIL